MTEENIEETQFEENTSEETKELDLDQGGEQVEGNNSEPDVETLKADLNKTKELNAKLYARLKKTETKKPIKTVKDSSNSNLTREEAILFAKGYTEEEVDLVNKLAKVNESSILETLEDPYIKTKVLERQKKENSAKASLGASGGSSKFQPKDVGSMSKEEHSKLYHDTMSKIQ